jgi:hypothetical protein
MKPLLLLLSLAASAFAELTPSERELIRNSAPTRPSRFRFGPASRRSLWKTPHLRSSRTTRPSRASRCQPSRRIFRRRGNATAWPSSFVPGAATAGTPGKRTSCMPHRSSIRWAWLSSASNTARVRRTCCRTKASRRSPCSMRNAPCASCGIARLNGVIDPAKVGVAGYSAGANLAMNLAANFDLGDPQATDPIDRLSSRPDFAVGLGTWHWRKPENPFVFKPNSPPVFLVHATTDKPVEIATNIIADSEKARRPRPPRSPRRRRPRRRQPHPHPSETRLPRRPVAEGARRAGCPKLAA